MAAKSAGSNDEVFDLYTQPMIRADGIQPSDSEMEFRELVHVPQYETACGPGYGLAACAALGLLVTSDCRDNTLSVWSLPVDGDAVARIGSGFARVCTLGGDGSPAPMQFNFSEEITGFLAFTPQRPNSSSDTTSLLLVTDHVRDAVHIVDVVTKTHKGYVAAPGTISGPHGVAASKELAAVSAWKEVDRDDHVVHIYRVGSGGASHWTHTRVIGNGFGGLDGRLDMPFGLRFSGDGSAICVADYWNNRASLFRVRDGGFVRHITTGLRCPFDVMEMEGGWVVACIGAVEFVSNGGGREAGSEDVLDTCALALVPGLGLVVRESGKRRLQVFSTPDLLAMRAMSVDRVGWMIATYRAAVNRQSLLDAKRLL